MNYPSKISKISSGEQISPFEMERELSQLAAGPPRLNATLPTKALWLAMRCGLGQPALPSKDSGKMHPTDLT
jgi:hypothetical protein